MYFNFNRIKRGRLNESIINKYFRDINQDLLELYMNMDDVRETAEVLKSVGNMHTAMLNRLDNIIAGQIDALGSGIVTNTLYNSDDVFFPKNINTTEYANVEYDFGMATCGVMDTHRIFTVIQDDEIVLASNAYKNVSRVISNNKFREKADKITENDIMRAFDPQDEQPYLLTIETRNASFTEAELILNILNINEMINTIKLRPIPLLELDINKFNMVDDTGEIPITNPIGTELSIPISNAENIFITFPEKQVSSVDMIIAQKNKSETIPYEFPIGFTDINIAFNEYYNKSYVGFKFNVPQNEDETYQRIKAVNFNWTYLEKFTRAFLYNNQDDADKVSDNYIDLITTDNIIYTQPKRIDDDTLYIVVELTKLLTNTSPIIRSCSVEFI